MKRTYKMEGNTMEGNLSGAAKIKVIGIGGGGNNAINNMIDAGIKSAEFLAVNTDHQAILMSHAQNTLIIGKDETNGLGAGADPSVGEKAALASRNEIREHLKNVNLLFITAGMGGGTGTGAAPIIASIANELNILTVAVVTKPFAFEGKRRMMNAERGIENLRKFVDTLVVIPNEKLLVVMPQNTTMPDAFLYADEVLRKAIQGISDLIVIPALINLDFADVRTVMRKKGLAHMGIGESEGPDRMMNAIRQAVMSPLLETNIGGSSAMILNVVGGLSITLMEITDACNKVRNAVDESANIIFGAGIDENLGEKVRVTLIATGFGLNDDAAAYASQLNDGGNPQQKLIPNTGSMTNEEFTHKFDADEIFFNDMSQNPDMMPNYNENMNNNNNSYNGGNNSYRNNNNSNNQLANGVTTNFVGNKVTTPNNNISPTGFFQQTRPTLTLNGNAFTNPNNVGNVNNTVNPAQNGNINRGATSSNGNFQPAWQGQRPNGNNTNNGYNGQNQNNGYPQKPNNQQNGYNNNNASNQNNSSYSNGNNNQYGSNNQNGYANQNNSNQYGANNQNNEDNTNQDFPPFLNRLKRK